MYDEWLRMSSYILMVGEHMLQKKHTMPNDSLAYYFPVKWHTTPYILISCFYVCKLKAVMVSPQPPTLILNLACFVLTVARR